MPFPPRLAQRDRKSRWKKADVFLTPPPHRRCGPSVSRIALWCCSCCPTLPFRPVVSKVQVRVALHADHRGTGKQQDDLIRRYLACGLKPRNPVSGGWTTDFWFTPPPRHMRAPGNGITCVEALMPYSFLANSPRAWRLPVGAETRRS